MRNQKVSNFKGLKYFKSKKYFRVFRKMFKNIENNVKIKSLFEVENKLKNDDSYPLFNEISSENEFKEKKWKTITNALNQEIYLDFSCNIIKTKEEAEFILSYLSYSYIKKFCQENYNKLKQISKEKYISIKSLKDIYLDLCSKYLNNKSLVNRSRNIKSNLEIRKSVFTQESKNVNTISNNNTTSNTRYNRASLFITEKFTSIICKRDSFHIKHKRASILEKYNAINVKKEEDNKEGEQDKLELNYFSRNQLPVGHITNKFIGPTDEKSILSKHRKLLISFKLRQNALNYLKEKKINMKLKMPLNQENTYQNKTNEKPSKSSRKSKINHLTFPSLKSCGSSSSFNSNHNKLKIINNYPATTRNKINKFIPRFFSAKRRIEKNNKNKVSKSTTKNYFSKMDMFYY